MKPRDGWDMNTAEGGSYQPEDTYKARHARERLSEAARAAKASARDLLGIKRARGEERA